MQRAVVCATIAVLALAVSPEARADWQGVARAKVDPPPPRGEAAQEGMIYGKGPKVRVELQGRLGKAAVIFDGASRKKVLVLEERRGFLAVGLDDPMPGHPGAQLAVACDGADPTPCLAAAGFRKEGSEKVNGQKATRWSREEQTPHGVFHQDLWTADGFKEFALVRQVTKKGNRTVTLDVEGLKKAPQADALFAVPAGFTNLGDKLRRRGPGGRLALPRGDQDAEQ